MAQLRFSRAGQFVTVGAMAGSGGRCHAAVMCSVAHASWMERHGTSRCHAYRSVFLSCGAVLGNCTTPAVGNTYYSSSSIVLVLPYSDNTLTTEELAK